MKTKTCVGMMLLCCSMASLSVCALDMDRLRVKRKEIYEFTEKPGATRKGDEVTITFAVKDFCDVTVAVEDAGGKIIRYLASGVLGDNAPVPFQKNSRKQTIVWDGKDELAKYVENKERLTVRVSLGLRARMERTLFWSPYRRAGGGYELMRATPEGVYVFSPGLGAQLSLFDLDGNYVRTVYPFPRDKIDKVQGLKWLEFPPDNERLPSKLNGHDQNTLLPDFLESKPERKDDFTRRRRLCAMAMDVRNGRICLAGGKALFFSTDGSSGDMPLVGPRVDLTDEFSALLAHSVALSPDGKRAYVTGYMRHARKRKGNDTWAHCVNVVDRETGKMTLFAGAKLGQKPPKGSDNAHFRCPMSVACDAQGRVYVADNYNNRVQVFLPDGTFYKTIPVTRPGIVRINPKNGNVWVIPSHLGVGEGSVGAEDWYRTHGERGSKQKWPWGITVFGPVEKPERKAFYGGLPEGAYGWDRGLWFYDINVEIDFHTNPPTVWTCDQFRPIRLWQPQGKKLVLKKDFGTLAQKALVRPRPWIFGRTRLAVHPLTGRLYVGLNIHGTPSWPSSFREVVVIDPETGGIKVEALPTDAEDMAFDWEGRAYLRTYNAVTRFDPRGWREIPFDYGEERTVRQGGTGDAKPYRARSAMMLPSGGRGGLHLGGFGVSPQGMIVTSCINKKDPAEKDRMKEKKIQADDAGGDYIPPIYPGRCRGYETHIFDIHGKLIKEDVAPGIGKGNDVEIDRDGNVYLLAASTPYLDGKAYFNGRGCTLMKLKPGKMKGLAIKNARIPLEEANRPKRPLDMTRPGLWIEGAEWLFGPVGADGHWGSGGRCHCRTLGRFALDYYGRSFVPEVDRFRFVVLDTNGNVIMRIGQYGNVDDGMPLVKPDPSRVGKQGGQPSHPRSIGADEVATMHAQYVKVHCDKRLFLSDVGNQCIRSVKLDYHVEEKVSLSGVPDQEK